MTPKRKPKYRRLSMLSPGRAVKRGPNEIKAPELQRARGLVRQQNAAYRPTRPARRCGTLPRMTLAQMKARERRLADLVQGFAAEHGIAVNLVHWLSREEEDAYRAAISDARAACERARAILAASIDKAEWTMKQRQAP